VNHRRAQRHAVQSKADAGGSEDGDGVKQHCGRSLAFLESCERSWYQFLTHYDSLSDSVNEGNQGRLGKRDFGAKRPHYAARMVRAFHERTFSHLKVFESEGQQAERRIEATVSMVRKWETNLENIIRLHPNDRLPEHILTTLSTPILEYWAGIGIPYDEDKWKKTVDGFYKGESIKDGHENLYQYVHSLFRGLHLNVMKEEEIWEKYGFQKIESDYTRTALEIILHK
jgi:hypothetical protein